MKTIIVGAGPVGLATAMLLARDGHDVTVLEKDPDDVRESWDDGWANWQRAGVAQFHQPHFMQPRFRSLIDTELPAVRDRIEKLGGRRFTLTRVLPPAVREARRGDERFETITARRPVLEMAFAQVARETPRVDVVRGVAVVALQSTLRAGIPHVQGVRTDQGTDLAADLVVDAMGRRSKLVEWVQAIGGRPPYEEASDAGFAYYSRHYSSSDGSVPEYRAPMGVLIGTFQTLTILGDNGCWTVALLPMAGDRPLKALRHNEVWERVVGAVPHMAGWTDGTPLCDVLAMAGVLDRYRRIIVDDRPVVTGLLPVGDAWACTNPTAGRGISLGLTQATLLRDAMRGHADDALRLVLEYDRMTEETLTPWYRDQVGRDRRRARLYQALIDGAQPPRPNGEAGVAIENALLAGFAVDPDVARGWLDVIGCLALPSEVAGRPEIAEKLGRFRDGPLHPFAGPTREELLALVN